METAQAARRRRHVRRQRRPRVHDRAPRGTRGRDVREPDLAAEYRRRVAAVMDTVTSNGGYLVWIGLPISRDAEQTLRYDVINAIVQTEAAKRKGRVSYLDTYFFFAGEDGGYAQYVEDASGKLVKMRADDGVHFERAAGDLIADEGPRAPLGALRLHVVAGRHLGQLNGHGRAQPQRARSRDDDRLERQLRARRTAARQRMTPVRLPVNAIHVPAPGARARRRWLVRFQQPHDGRPATGSAGASSPRAACRLGPSRRPCSATACPASGFVELVDIVARTGFAAAAEAAIVNRHRHTGRRAAARPSS